MAEQYLTMADEYVNNQTIPETVISAQSQRFSNEPYDKAFERAYALAMASNFVPENFYTVDILLNNNNFGDYFRDIPLVCHAAELPGRIFATSSQKTYGPEEKFPVLTSFDDLTLSFICYGDNFFPKDGFEMWMEYINPSTRWNFKYKSKYTAIINIKQYAKTGQLIYLGKLTDVFPIAIYPQKVNFASQDHTTLQVGFTYKYFEGQSFPLTHN